ncbi:MAG TPA: rRNA maturation RNase YbeY, partial [Flavisolibacter sp.]
HQTPRMTTVNKRIRFHYQTKVFSLRKRTQLKQFIAGLIKKEGHQLDELACIFCTDDYLHRINMDHLGHDTLTDIVTFQFNQPGQAIQGEVYVSVERVRENATIFGVPYIQELHRVIFHGALHLCGYRDKKPKDKAVMTDREDFYLGRYCSTWN